MVSIWYVDRILLKNCIYECRMLLKFISRAKREIMHNTFLIMLGRGEDLSFLSKIVSVGFSEDVSKFKKKLTNLWCKLKFPITTDLTKLKKLKIGRLEKQPIIIWSGDAKHKFFALFQIPLVVPTFLLIKLFSLRKMLPFDSNTLYFYNDFINFH